MFGSPWGNPDLDAYEDMLDKEYKEFEGEVKLHTPLFPPLWANLYTQILFKRLIYIFVCRFAYYYKDLTYL